MAKISNKTNDWFIYSLGAFGVLSIFIIFAFVSNPESKGFMFTVVVFLLGLVGMSSRWKSQSVSFHKFVCYSSIFCLVCAVILALGGNKLYGKRINK